jgi:lipopolysaccharide transport system permease protein
MQNSLLPLTRIEPPAGRVRLGLPELWEYRDLIFFLAWRDVKLRYKQTVIGTAWALLQPLMTMVIFTTFLGRVVKVSTGDIPYPLFAYSALVPWSYFSHALTKSIACMVNDHPLVTQIYIPRMILPLAAVLGGLPDFAIAFLALVVMLLYYGAVPALSFFAMPFFALLVVATAFGVSLWLAPLNALYRDVANAVPFLVQLWLIATPIAYPSTLIPEPWRAFYGLNPMAGAIEGFRWTLIRGAAPLPVSMVAISIVTTFVMIVTGLYFFQYRERTLADMV